MNGSISKEERKISVGLLTMNEVDIMSHQKKIAGDTSLIPNISAHEEDKL